MADGRDVDLGAALRQLEVPAHGSDFYPRLRDRLIEEAANPVGPSGRQPHQWRRPLYLVATAAAVVLVVLVTSVALPGRARGPGLGGPQVANAAEVRTRVARALATTRTLRAELTLECAISISECAPPSENGQQRAVVHWSVVATASGDERITAIGAGGAAGGGGAGGAGGASGVGGDTAYRAQQGTEQSIADPAQHAHTPAIESTGMAPGPPDSGRRSPLARDYGAVVRAFLDSGADAPVANTVVDGRRAWQVGVPVQPNKLAGPGRSGDRLDIVVDQASGFPLRVTETLAGRFLYELRLSNLVVDSPVDPSTFVLNMPTGPNVAHIDYGFRATPLDQVAAVVGYQPVLPTDIPAGYRIAQITVARQSQATGSEGLDPPSRNVVSVAFRRGFDLIVVTTRSTGANRSAWYDPMGTGEGVADQPQRFTVAQGALTGATAELVVTLGGTPHVWAINDHLVVTVSGDASRDEFARMIASFR
jgi:hypothetical protein